MESQNNKTPHNIEVNEVKPPKKKIKVSTIIIIVLVVLLLFSCVDGSGGSSESSTSTSTANHDTVESDNAKEEKEENDIKAEDTRKEAESESVKTEEDEEQPTEQAETEELDSVQDSNNQHMHIGDVITYKSGLILRIQEAGIYRSQPFNTPLVYMELECENTSDEIITIYNNDLELYIDDYQIDVVPEVNGDDPAINYSVDINPGRKMIFKPVAKLPDDYESAYKIELSFTGWYAEESLLIKDNGVYLYGFEESPTASINFNDDWYVAPLDDKCYGDYADVNDVRFISIIRDRYDQGNTIFFIYYDETEPYFEGELELLSDNGGEIYDFITMETIATFEFTSDGNIELKSGELKLSGTFYKQ